MYWEWEEARIILWDNWGSIALLSVIFFEKIIKGIVLRTEKWSQGINYNKNEGKNMNWDKIDVGILVENDFYSKMIRLLLAKKGAEKRINSIDSKKRVL